MPWRKLFHRGGTTQNFLDVFAGIHIVEEARVLPSAPLKYLHMAGKRDPELKKNARGTYNTRVDPEFCKGRGC